MKPAPGGNESSGDPAIPNPKKKQRRHGRKREEWSIGWRIFEQLLDFAYRFARSRGATYVEADAALNIYHNKLIKGETVENPIALIAATIRQLRRRIPYYAQRTAMFESKYGYEVECTIMADPEELADVGEQIERQALHGFFAENVGVLKPGIVRETASKYYLERKTEREIALETGVKYNTICVRLKRAREQMARISYKKLYDKAAEVDTDEAPKDGTSG